MGEHPVEKLAPGKKFQPFVVAGCVYLLFIQVVFMASGISRLRDGNFDFRHLYTAGYMVRTGQGNDIYSYEVTKQIQEKLVGPKAITAVFNHLAFEAILFVPLSFFGFRSAYFLWMGVNTLLLVGCFVLLRHYYRPFKAIWRFLPIALFVVFFPFAFAMIQGQDSIVLTALLTCAVLASENGSDYAAGALLSAGLFKFQFVLPIVALTVVWRKWKIALGFLAGTVLVGSISLAVIGPSAARTYSHYLLALSSANQQAYGVHPFLMANFRGLFSGVAESALGHAGAQALTLVASVALFLWACRQKFSMPVAIVTSILVSYHSLPHDLSLLIIPLVLAPSQKNFSGSAWVSEAILFAAPGVAFAWVIPFWVVIIPMLVFMWQIAHENDPLPALPEYPAAMG